MQFLFTKLKINLSQGLWLPSLLFILILSSFGPLARSEYRAYELEIGPRRVITTLDPQQYVQLHPLNPGEQVQYLSSWMCWGSTAHHKPICPRPPEYLDREPATDESLEAPGP